MRRCQQAQRCPLGPGAEPWFPHYSDGGAQQIFALRRFVVQLLEAQPVERLPGSVAELQGAAKGLVEKEQLLAYLLEKCCQENTVWVGHQRAPGRMKQLCGPRRNPRRAKAAINSFTLSRRARHWPPHTQSNRPGWYTFLIRDIPSTTKVFRPVVANIARSVCWLEKGRKKVESPGMPIASEMENKKKKKNDLPVWYFQVLTVTPPW